MRTILVRINAFSGYFIRLPHMVTIEQQKNAGGGNNDNIKYGQGKHQ